ncbi:unnamed protein product [Arabidopsis lyrata]|uniref:Uncharacterized protein n=1 Tax=Arabidopsis lyrata subsp. lyrata TaxID=81972 RepID=D7L8U0_ARALL|nr:uncharacterized protein LOC9322174 [Arabidopsis lyrata subsp. lyrata]EFH62367.1 hypothetical protein ARALYDRAFT_900069 [Arabidopsis lyrata subsp. lyrata]CAH8262630.1 unnamed protein product [Arabidopsis lyrata]|eukprot:XP_002886108.1 uncharacterized protein LOC9322174 [Arabidopsis lyrata subsp. lyrata]
MSSSIMKTLQIRKPTSLPISSTTTDEPGLLRRRLSSLSLNLSRNQPSTVSRSKSVSDMGEQGGSSVKEWWEWSWSWILLKKLPIFFTDLEVNKNETKSSLGNSFTHVFFKLRSEIRRLLRPSSDSLPLSCKHGQR